MASTATRKTRSVSPAKAAEREAKITELKDRLSAAILGLDNEDRWLEYLTFIQQFGVQYSPSNQMLLWIECMFRGFEPRLVRSFGAWFKAATHEAGCAKERKTCRCRDLNVPTRPADLPKGAPFGLPVWAPVKRRLNPQEVKQREERENRRIPVTEKGWSVASFLVGFTIEHVFDVSQLRRPDEVEVPEPLSVRRRVRQSGPQAELLTGEDTTGALLDVVALIEAQGYSYERGAPSAGANGTTYWRSHRVVVRADVSDAQAVKTSVHELAHILCGHTPEDGFDYRQHRGQAETEAESVAYIVCGALGLDTEGYSAPYVSDWSGGKEEVIRRAAETVTRVAKVILDALDPAIEPEVGEAVVELATG